MAQGILEEREKPVTILWEESRIVLKQRTSGVDTISNIGSIEVKLDNIGYLDERNSLTDYCGFILKIF